MIEKTESGMVVTGDHVYLYQFLVIKQHARMRCLFGDEMRGPTLKSVCVRLELVARTWKEAYEKLKEMTPDGPEDTEKFERILELLKPKPSAFCQECGREARVAVDGNSFCLVCAGLD